MYNREAIGQSQPYWKLLRYVSVFNPVCIYSGSTVVEMKNDGEMLTQDGPAAGNSLHLSQHPCFYTPG